jgi:hypothetical protein
MMSLPTFTQREVQDMLDAAQLNAGILFSDIIFLRDQLQVLFQENLMECNSQDINPTELLGQVLYIERKVLDAYNRHRLGNAVTIFNEYALDPENVVEYNEEDNVPEKLEWFPLRAAVANYGVLAVLPPIYQLESTIEDNQKYTAKPAVFAKEPAPPKITNSRKAGARLKATPENTVNSGPSAKGKKSTGFGSASYDKLRDAPSPWLGLPRGNLTLAEMTAFIPHAIKSYDIMDRFLYNGALSGTFANMINQYRVMPHGRIENNSIYRMMKGPMEHRAKVDPTYEKWTVVKHAAIQKPAGFDPASVSVAGFSTPVNFNSRQSTAATTQPPPSILFRDMANGVKIMPSGYDALDLTRCIEYCVKHNDGSWRYPQDFEQLVAILGGATTVYREHQDDAAISRHTSEKKRMNAKRAGGRQRSDRGRLLKQRRGFLMDSDEEEALSEGSEESEEDTNNIDSDTMDDHEPVTATKRDAKRKNIFGDEMSDEDDLMPQIGASSRRKHTTPDDGVYEQAPTRRTPKRSKKPPPKTHAHRSQKSLPSCFRKEALLQGIDSEFDGDAYAGPKRKNKKVVVATRSSTRNQRFSGSYTVEGVLETEEDKEGEEDEESEDEAEDILTPKKQLLAPAQMHLAGRKRNTDANDIVKDDEDDSETTEDTSGDDDDFDL